LPGAAHRPLCSQNTTKTILKVQRTVPSRNPEGKTGSFFIVFFVQAKGFCLGVVWCFMYPPPALSGKEGAVYCCLLEVAFQLSK
jgi:hypothetical protein